MKSKNVRTYAKIYPAHKSFAEKELTKRGLQEQGENRNTQLQGPTVDQELSQTHRIGVK